MCRTEGRFSIRLRRFQFNLIRIPFPINQVTLHSNPLKYREYLAAGLPVISTAIPEVQAVGLTRIGHNRQDFVEQVRSALRDPGPSRSRSDLMRDQSWEARVSEISVHANSDLGALPGRIVRSPRRPIRAAGATLDAPRRLGESTSVTAG